MAYLRYHAALPHTQSISCTRESLSNAAGVLVSAARAAAAADGKDLPHAHLESWQARLRDQVDIDCLDDSFSKFINSELDFEASGDRGLGRLHSEPPRLGAYLRTKLKSLTGVRIADLYGRIQAAMVFSYCYVAFLDDVAVPAIPCDVAYERWIPRIYASELTPSMQIVRKPAFNRPLADLMAFMAANDLSGGGLLRSNKVPSIVCHYINGAVALRLTQTQG